MEKTMPLLSINRRGIFYFLRTILSYYRFFLVECPKKYVLPIPTTTRYFSFCFFIFHTPLVMKHFLLRCLVLFGLFPFGLNAQNEHLPIIQDFLNQQVPQQPWKKADVAEWTLNSQHRSRLSGVHYVYLQQTHQGIPVVNGTATLSIKDGAIQSMGARLVLNLHPRTPPTFKDGAFDFY